jgi:hypothetical protein
MSLNSVLGSADYALAVNTLMSALTGFDNYYGISQQDPTVQEIGQLASPIIPGVELPERSQGYGAFIG